MKSIIFVTFAICAMAQGEVSTGDDTFASSEVSAVLEDMSTSASAAVSSEDASEEKGKDKGLWHKLMKLKSRRKQDGSEDSEERPTLAEMKKKIAEWKERKNGNSTDGEGRRGWKHHGNHTDRNGTWGGWKHHGNHTDRNGTRNETWTAMMIERVEQRLERGKQMKERKTTMKAKLDAIKEKIAERRGNHSGMATGRRNHTGGNTDGGAMERRGNHSGMATGRRQMGSAFWAGKGFGGALGGASVAAPTEDAKENKADREGKKADREGKKADREGKKADREGKKADREEKKADREEKKQGGKKGGKN